MPARAVTDTVVLIHGLGRTPRSMWVIAAWLKKKGFRVLRLGYPSRRVSIVEAVEDYIQPQLDELAAQLESGAQVHFVTHSLGGIVFRAWAAQRPADFPLGRAVLLAPPNRGSEIIDDVRQLPWVRWWLGPVAAELGTDAESTPNRLGPLPPNTGVIMGNRSPITMFQHLLGEESDGLVTVESAKGDGAADFTLMSTDHALILAQPNVLRAMHRFLVHGRFHEG